MTCLVLKKSWSDIHTERQLNKANSFDTEALFMDFDV